MYWLFSVEVVLQRVLVLFQAGTTPLLSGLGMLRSRSMRSFFARYLAYNITILQTIDITVSSNVWSICYM